jgi:peptidoglycan/LPS O-acetylase OafA/YrhL
MQTNIDRIHGLDGIRACAFLLVVAGHCGFKWIPNGFGVTVFFFLSGYLITTLLRLEWIRNGSISISGFYTRRAFRILPPLYCGMFLALAAAWFGILHAEVQWKAVLAIQLFLTNYAQQIPGLSIPLGLSPLWSLAVEEHFYLLFPWIYWALLRSRARRVTQAIVLGGVCVATLIWRLILMGHFGVFWNRVYTGTDTRLDSILFGAIFALAANPVIDRLPGITRRRSAAAALLGLAILVITIAARGEFFRQTARYTLQGLALAPVFFYVVSYSDSIVTKCLDCKLFTTIGDLSYSLYLVHYTVMFAINTWITNNPALTLVLTLTISCALAEIVRRTVERPATRLRNFVLHKARVCRIKDAAPAAV